MIKMKKIIAGIVTVAVCGCALGALADARKNCLNALAEYDRIMQKRLQGSFTPQDSIDQANSLKASLAAYDEWAVGSESNNMPEDMAKAIGRHYNDYTVASIYMMQNKDYKDAYDMLRACVDLPDNPLIGKGIVNPQNDRGELAFHQGVAATQAGMREQALIAYEKAFELGFNEQQLFDSAILAAEQSGDKDLAYRWAERGAEKYGISSLYREYMIKYAIEKDLLKALDLVNKTIEADPDNIKWYNKRVIIYEKLHDHKASLLDLWRITQLAPEDAMSRYNYGMKLHFMATLAENLGNGSKTDKEEKKRLTQQAAEELETACRLGLANKTAQSSHIVNKSLNILDQIYHANGDKEGKKRVAEYRKQLSGK